MTDTGARLPDGFTVRLHDDVTVGASFARDARFYRADPVVREALHDRTVVVHDDLTAKVGARLLDLDLGVPVLGSCGRFTVDDLTVVIPVRDRAAGVERLLAALADQVTCIVVDDDSVAPEPLRDVARRHGAELVRLEENVGPAAARNAGLRRVSTPLVAFIDSDVSVGASDLEALLGHFADTGLAAVAPRVRAETGERWFQRYERSEGGLDQGAVPATVRTWSTVAYLPSACLVARVEAIGNGFDERMRSGEDVDLVWRLLAEGWRVRYEPAVVVEHDQRSSGYAWAERQFFYGTSAAPLAERHGVLVAPAVLTPVQAVFLLSIAVTRGRWRFLSLVLALLVGVRAWRLAAAEPVANRARLAVSVVTTTLRQGTDLVVQHAAPLSVIAALVSHRTRRVLLVLGLVEAVYAWLRSDRSTDLVRFVAARRLSTAAYGCGVWRGALEEKAWRAVVPHVIHPKPGTSR